MVVGGTQAAAADVEDCRLITSQHQRRDLRCLSSLAAAMCLAKMLNSGGQGFLLATSLAPRRSAHDELFELVQGFPDGTGRHGTGTEWGLDQDH